MASSSGAVALRPPAPDNHLFRSSAGKSRLVGATHWTFPCNDTYVLKSFLERPQDFGACQAGLNELKFQVSIYNVIPTSLSIDDDNTQSLSGLLPDRLTSEQYIRQYGRSYARLYNFIEPAELLVDLDHALDDSTTSNPIHLLRCLLAIAISMQSVESKRLIGRRIAYEVEHCVWFSRRLQKPCIGVMQLLLLLIVVKTITSADMGPAYDLLKIHGLTSQIAFSMGLNRDPSLFNGLSPYHAEVRKRIWACFFRLGLEFSTQSGTQLTLRLEDSDCPLPSDASLSEPAYNPEDNRQLASGTLVEIDDDALFNLTAMKLAIIVAPVHQSRLSLAPRNQDDLQAELQKSFRSFLDDLPSTLRLGEPRDDPIQELQQSIISVMMHTSLLITSMASITSLPSSTSQQGELLDTWNYASSILYQFQKVTQTPEEDTSSAAFHLLWTHAGRAAFSACVIIGRLRNIDRRRMIPVHPTSSASVFCELLAKLLTSMLELWLRRSHRGPVPVKTYIMLSICQVVTSHLYSIIEHGDGREEIYRRAVSSAEDAIVELKSALQQHQSRSTAEFGTDAVVFEDTSSGYSTTEINFDDFSLPTDAFVDFSASGLYVDFLQSLSPAMDSA